MLQGIIMKHNTLQRCGYAITDTEALVEMGGLPVLQTTSCVCIIILNEEQVYLCLLSMHHGIVDCLGTEQTVCSLFGLMSCYENIKKASSGPETSMQVGS